MRISDRVFGLVALLGAVAESVGHGYQFYALVGLESLLRGSGAAAAALVGLPAGAA